MDESTAAPTPRRAVVEAVEGALAEVERALADFQKAYLAWTQATGLDATIRRGLLAEAETRLRAAQEALMALEAELAVASEETEGR